MGLDANNTTGVINHGSAAIVDNVLPVTFTFWCYFNSFNAARYLLQKNANEPYIRAGGFPTANKISLFWSNGGVNDLSYLTANTLTVNTWHHIAVTVRTGLLTPRVYFGQQGVVPRLTTGATLGGGKGFGFNNAAANLIVGSSSDAGAASPDWNVAHFSMWNKVLTLNQIIAQWHRPHRHDDGSCVVMSDYGFNGTGTQADFSGNGNNASVTDMIQADHVPINRSAA